MLKAIVFSYKHLGSARGRAESTVCEGKAWVWTHSMWEVVKESNWRGCQNILGPYFFPFTQHTAATTAADCGNDIQGEALFSHREPRQAVNGKQRQESRVKNHHNKSSRFQNPFQTRVFRWRCNYFLKPFLQKEVALYIETDRVIKPNNCHESLPLTKNP